MTLILEIAAGIVLGAFVVFILLYLAYVVRPWLSATVSRLRKDEPQLEFPPPEE